MKEKSIVTLDAASVFVLWIASSAIPFRLLALTVPLAKVNFWYLGVAVLVAIAAIAAATIRYEDGWRVSGSAGQLWNRLSLVSFGAIVGVWGLWLN